jgi:hypothetical protein
MVKTMTTKLEKWLPAFETLRSKIYLQAHEEVGFADVCTEVAVVANAHSNTSAKLADILFSQQLAAIPKIIPPTPTVTRLGKLPDLSVPTFTGEPHEWLAFADLFKTIVHDNTQLSNVTRLQYLKGALRGEARSHIRVLSSGQ